MILYRIISYCITLYHITSAAPRPADGQTGAGLGMVVPSVSAIFDGGCGVMIYFIKFHPDLFQKCYENIQKILQT